MFLCQKNIASNRDEEFTLVASGFLSCRISIAAQGLDLTKVRNSFRLNPKYITW
jgi:hypothetical protein